MKTGKIQQNLAFKRALTDNEKKVVRSLLQQAKEHLSEDGKSILIVHEPCLPQDKETDTGIGHLSSKTSLNFFDYAKNYLGINTIEVLPPGEIQLKGNKEFYNSYNGSALSLGSQGINLELLTTDEGNNLLSKQDLMEVVQNNTVTQKVGFANYENIIGSTSKQEQALKKAFYNFQNRNDIDKTDFENYKVQNESWLERKAIYSALKEKNEGKSWREWEDSEKNLFCNIDGTKQTKIAQIKSKYIEKIEFYKFKQYLAEKHLQKGKQNLNDKGMKLFGDCLIGFSEDEVWAFRDAFKFDEKGKVVNIGLPEWKLPALNYDEIDKKNSPAQNLLKMKVELFARRYDGIRFDSSWSYITPKLSDGSKFDFGGKLLDIIENTVKSVKGEDYNQNDLIHEFEAAPEDFSLFDKIDNKNQIKPFLQNRVKIISSANMNDNYGSAYIMRKLGANPNSYIIGVGNHDPQPLRQIADNIPEKVNGKNVYRKSGQINILKRIFDIGYNNISNPTDFVKYKFAEPMTAKNNMIFYMDLFGRSDRFDSQDQNGWKNYRQRINTNFEKSIQEAQESGYGYNPLDASAKAFKKKGLDVKHKDLYDKLVKYANIISEKTSKTPEIKASEPERIVEKKHKKDKSRKLLYGGIAVCSAITAMVISAAKNGLGKL